MEEGKSSAGAVCQTSTVQGQMWKLGGASAFRGSLPHSSSTHTACLWAACLSAKINVHNSLKKRNDLKVGGATYLEARAGDCPAEPGLLP